MNKDVLDEVNAREPFCCERNLFFHDHVCLGRITREHAVYYAGRKIDEAWAIVLLCAWAHEVYEYQDGGGMVKEMGEYIAIMRMTKEDEERYPRKDWEQRRSYLRSKYGDLPTLGGV